MKKKKAKTIGEMTNSRRMWGFDASTRVVRNKKGKGSYTRKGRNSIEKESFFICFYLIRNFAKNLCVETPQKSPLCH